MILPTDCSVEHDWRVYPSPLEVVFSPGYETIALVFQCQNCPETKAKYKKIKHDEYDGWIMDFDDRSLMNEVRKNRE